MVLACLLTLLTFALAWLWPQNDELAGLHVGSRAVRICAIWFGGVWNQSFLVFALQMCVVPLTGYGLAKAPAATRLLHFLAGRVKSNRSAVVLVAGAPPGAPAKGCHARLTSPLRSGPTAPSGCPRRWSRRRSTP